jgi:hypothetical protein
VPAATPSTIIAQALGCGQGWISQRLVEISLMAGPFHGCGPTDAPDHWEIIRFGWKTPTLMMTAAFGISKMDHLLENIED